MNQLARDEQEYEHDEEEHGEAGQDAGHHELVKQLHIPGANTEGLVLVVVEGGDVGWLCGGNRSKSRGKESLHFINYITLTTY